MSNQEPETGITFRHRGLKRLYEKEDTSRVDPRHVVRLRDILTMLDQSSKPSDMNVPGLDFHKLRGRPADRYSVSVSGNWRVTFRFEDGRACDVDYLDYH